MGLRIQILEQRLGTLQKKIEFAIRQGEEEKLTGLTKQVDATNREIEDLRMNNMVRQSIRKLTR